MPPQKLLYSVLHIINHRLDCGFREIINIIFRHSPSYGLVQIDKCAITSLLLICHLLRTLQHLHADFIQRNAALLLGLKKPVKPHLLAYNKRVYTHFVLNIRLDMNIAKADIPQFTIMVNAEEASSRNKEATERMIVTLISLFMDFVFIIKRDFRVTIGNPDISSLLRNH